MGIFLIGHHTLLSDVWYMLIRVPLPLFFNPIRYIILLWSAIFKSVYLPYDKCKLSVVNMNKVRYMANLSNLPVLNVYEVAISCPPRLKQYTVNSFTRLMDFVYKMYSLLNIDNKKKITSFFQMTNSFFMFHTGYGIVC